MSNADVIIATAYNAWKNADYIYNGVMRVASACKEDEVEVIDAWEPGEDFDLQKEYEQENKIRWALELALH